MWTVIICHFYTSILRCPIGNRGDYGPLWMHLFWCCVGSSNWTLSTGPLPWWPSFPPTLRSGCTTLLKRSKNLAQSKVAGSLVGWCLGYNRHLSDCPGLERLPSRCVFLRPLFSLTLQDHGTCSYWSWVPCSLIQENKATSHFIWYSNS